MNEPNPNSTSEPSRTCPISKKIIFLVTTISILFYAFSLYIVYFMVNQKFQNLNDPRNQTNVNNVGFIETNKLIERPGIAF